MAKILGRSKNGIMLRMEDPNNPKGTWYFMTEQVQKFATPTNFPDGTDVEFKSEEIKGEDTITFISKKGSTPPNSGSGSGSSSYEKKSYGKSPEEQNSILKQACMKASCDAIKTMTGIADVKTLGDMIETLYDRLYAKIS